MVDRSTPVEAEGARDALHWAMKYALTVPTDQIVLVLSCALGNAQCGPLCDTLMGVILNREAALRARIETLEGALRQIIREREEDPMQSGDPNVMLCAWCEDDVTKHADGCACAIARRALGTPLKGGAP